MFFRKKKKAEPVEVESHFDPNMPEDLHVVIYTNCQFLGIQYFLGRYYKSMGKNVRMTHLENYILIKNQGALDPSMLASADVFIYQPIAARHGIYSTSSDVEGSVVSYLSDDCEKIAFPYIYNSAMWCLVPPAIADNLIGGYGEYDQYLNKEVIEELIDSGHSLKQILKMFRRKQIDFKYAERFKQNIEILEEKEKQCDLVVSDYIVENVRKRKLFLTQNHPTTCVFIHCVNQILEKLGADYSFNADDFPDNVAGFSKGWPQSKNDLEYWQFTYSDVRVVDKFYRKHITRMYDRYTDK